MGFSREQGNQYISKSVGLLIQINGSLRLNIWQINGGIKIQSWVASVSYDLTL